MLVRHLRPLPPLWRVVVATVATVALAASTLTVTASPAHAGSYSAPLRTAIASLPVAAEVRTGYDRALFPHWKDADGDCQNARQEVLVAESRGGLTFTSEGRCTVATGRWSSYYDRAVWTAASDVDIDIVVALAEAWDSGARLWTTSRRQSYANDLGDARSLVAVTDEVNQSKGEQDPSTWLPTYDRCRFVREWTAVKIRWGLSVDAAEKDALVRQGARCTDVVVSVTTL